MEFLKTGGYFFTIPIFVMGIVSLLLFLWLISQRAYQKEINRKHIDLILFLGSFSLAYGILGQITGLYQAAGILQTGGEISPTLIWGGVRVSLIAPIMGFIVLLFSSFFWFLLKPKKK